MRTMFSPFSSVITVFDVIEKECMILPANAGAKDGRFLTKEIPVHGLRGSGFTENPPAIRRAGLIR